jgi:hypothetical protein
LTDKKGTKQSVALEDVINALQKSFSRVSSDSSKVKESEALALITGQVEFDLQVKLSPFSDRLLVDSQGVINLGLKGAIDVDVREESEID